MFKVKILILFLIVFLQAQQINISNFESNLYSKNGENFKKIILDMQIISAQNASEAAIKDALNVIIGSFYAEDLMTSKGKETLKNAFIKYANQKYSIKIDSVYILGLKFAADIDIDALKRLIEQKCQTNLNKEENSKQKKSAQKLIQEQMKNNAKIIDGMKEFGEIDFYQ